MAEDNINIHPTVIRFLKNYNISDNMEYIEFEDESGFQIYHDGDVFTINEIGNLHSFNDNPAMISSRYDVYYSNGKVHRDNGKPAKINKKNGMVSYYKNGTLHNTNGPSIVHSDGKKEFFVNGMPITKAYTKWAGKGVSSQDDSNFIIFLFENNFT